MPISTPKSFFGWLFYAVIALYAVVLFGIAVTAPNDFPGHAIITVWKGETLTDLSNELESDSIVKSALVFRLAVRLSDKEQKIQAGDYFFAPPLSVFGVIGRIVNGQYDVPTLRVTIPEGTSVAQIPPIVLSAASTTVSSNNSKEKAGTKLPFFNALQFLTLASGKEGYLFPDTYFLPEDDTAAGLIGVMEDNFNQKLATIEPSIEAFGTSTPAMAKWSHDELVANVVIMASILEKEARTTTTRRTIAGILWKRLQMGIPLEVDSTLTYVTGINTFNLTDADLATTSPYNTYLYKGLPPGPITNPGLDSLLDAVTPIQTPYLYYLSDSQGNMHYATTLAEHLKNIQLYLKE